tara:strand:+ start:9689 stop:10501 length:813 start_codon:yes stop_codon:yes gene_type:complete
MKNVVLFDMDGTLTPARKAMKPNMLDALADLAKVADIGIVSGSPYEYIKEQCNIMFEGYNELWLQDVVIMPCNGTQKYVWKDNKWQQHSDLDMREFIGDSVYHELLRELILEQHTCSINSRYMNYPLVGHFISYRQSMVNWCPVGRAASHDDRDQFIEADSIYKIRESALRRLKLNKRLGTYLEFALGGHTSIDIYPHGWDKTYALKHYSPAKTIWFVGDRCLQEAGNDKPLYDKINSIKPNSAFQTSGPEQTLDLIKDIIKQIESDGAI